MRQYINLFEAKDVDGEVERNQMRQYINLFESPNVAVIEMMIELEIDLPYQLDGNKISLIGNVDLSNKGLEKLPFEDYGFTLDKVTGMLNVTQNKLTSLDGFPLEVHGRVRASKNNIQSLKGIPTYINGDLVIGYQETDISPWETRYALFSKIEYGIYFEGHMLERELESIFSRFYKLDMENKKEEVTKYLEELSRLKG